MNINPYMDELRQWLDDNCVEYVVDDSEDETDEWSGAVLHVERTEFRGCDGRAFSVLFAWIRDEDDVKRFLTTHGKFGYVDVTVGDGEPYAATADEVIEDAFGRCR